MGILKRFLDGFDFVRMKPDNSVIRTVSGGLAARALAEPGKAYAIYLHVPLAEKPKKIEEVLRERVEGELTLELPAGAYRVEWIDTQTGKAVRAESIDHAGGARKLASPVFANDIALRMVRAAKP